MGEGKEPRTTNERLARKITKIQAQMEEELEEIRDTYDHAGTKGGEVERAVRDFLRPYLPPSYGVGHGEVIDTQNRRSRQTDIVIYSDQHPFTVRGDRPGLFFIEGVLAGAEVKTHLTTEELNDGIAKSRAFKELEAKDLKHTILRENPTDKKRFYLRRPYFILAFESALTLETIGERLMDEGDPRTHPILTPDAVIVLDRGFLWNMADGQGALKAHDDQGNVIQGWYYEKSEAGLYNMLRWLSGSMPRFTLFEPILVHYSFPNV